MTTPGNDPKWLSVHRPASLRRRELAALRAYAQTGDRRAAADVIGVRAETIKNYLHDAYVALGVTNAIDAFRERGWLVVPEEAH